MNGLVILHHFIRIEINQEDDTVFICQKKYVEKILKKFEIFGCNPTDTPLVVNEKLKKEDGGKKVDVSNYRSVVDNLFYLISTTPDIMFAANLLSRFMNDLSLIHLGSTKMMLRYIQSILNYEIKYEIKLIGFCGSD